MVLSVMDGAKRHGEFVADFQRQLSLLGIANMMHVGWGLALVVFQAISGYSGKQRWKTALASTQRKAFSTYRRRLKRRGVVRLEVHVRKDDAALVRGIVKALADPEREGEARGLAA
jgi:hypothetical protein